MDPYAKQQIIRYVGNKSKLVNFIVPVIYNETNPKDCVLDLFAGTCAVSHALKGRQQLITNDIQKYSQVIAKALIANNRSISQEQARADLVPLLSATKPQRYRLFESVYANTFFTKKQCIEIDTLRYAVDNYSGYKKNVYLVALMAAMSHCVNSPGHFAEYFSNGQGKSEAKRSISDYFFTKLDNINIVKSELNNTAYCSEFKSLFRKNRKKISKAALIYADPPYSAAQYSRYYHLLETLVKYDWPSVAYKAKYRTDRFQSDFSRKLAVETEFTKLFELCSTETDATVAISYVNHGRGLLSEAALKRIAKKFYRKILIKRHGNYQHSMNGNGSPKIVEEFLLVCK